MVGCTQVGHDDTPYFLQDRPTVIFTLHDAIAPVSNGYLENTGVPGLGNQHISQDHDDIPV
jgi:hypothetical protein